MLINCHYGAYPMHYALCTLFVREVSLGKFTKMCTLPSFSHSLSNLFSFFSPGIPLVITTKNPNKYFIISKVFVTMKGKIYFGLFFCKYFFLNLTKISPFSDPPFSIFHKKITKKIKKIIFFFLSKNLGSFASPTKGMNTFHYEMSKK